MTTAAVLLALLWLLTAVVLRIGIHVRRYRDTGLRSNAGPPLSVGWWARLLFTVSTVAVAAAPALVRLDVIAPAAALDAPTLQWIGALLAVTGIAATFSAQLAMGASWRIGVDPGERTELVTTGVFAVARNPIFSTMALTAAGLTIMTPTTIGVASLVLLVVALQLQVRAVEEPYLRSVHGAAYARYCERTGRFVPRLRSNAMRLGCGTAPAADVVSHPRRAGVVRRR
jgi:protein-S-isoprenylcysteine O-methyltransferase Ste14